MSEEFLPLSEPSSNHFSYLSPTLEGPIHPQTGDRAVFTCQLVRAGEILVVWGGQILKGLQLSQLPDQKLHFTIQGVEVCYDYAMSEGHPQAFQPFQCQCGAANCRRYITGKDWENPDLWQRYEGYFSPYLQHRIHWAKLKDI